MMKKLKKIEDELPIPFHYVNITERKVKDSSKYRLYLKEYSQKHNSNIFCCLPYKLISKIKLI